MKKFFWITAMSLTLLAPFMNSSVYSASFPDVPNSQTNSDAVEYVKAHDIVSGYADGTFKPERTIDRAEFVKIIIGTQFDGSVIDRCIAGNIAESTTQVFFPDVAKDAWFAKYLCVAKVHNILNGYSDGKFHANNEISFIEAAKIITNAFGYPTSANLLWYKPFVEKLAEKNAIPVTITGFEDRITRGEMAEIVYRLRANVTTKPTLNYEVIRQMSALCTGRSNGTPVISSISTTSWAVGTRLDIQGCNFSGFEGDKNLWIENDQGIKGILYGQSNSTAELVHVILDASLCQTDTSYSGLSCNKRLVLVPGKYTIYSNPWGKLSNRVEFTILGGNIPAFQTMSVRAGETEDITLNLTDGRWALKVQYGTGARVNVHFHSEGTKTLTVDLQTPLDANGNIRVSQIILPNGTMDGPFWKYMTYKLTWNGTYEIILAPNMMAGDPWSGQIDMNLKIE